jgi:hypothetical protein
VLKAKFRQLNTDLKFDISSIRICTESYWKIESGR